MTEIDIYSAKNLIGQQLSGISGVIGIGLNEPDNSIIIYIASSDSANEIIRRIGSNYYGYNIQFISTEKLKFL